MTICARWIALVALVGCSAPTSAPAPAAPPSSEPVAPEPVAPAPVTPTPEATPVIDPTLRLDPTLPITLRATHLGRGRASHVFTVERSCPLARVELDLEVESMPPTVACA